MKEEANDFRVNFFDPSYLRMSSINNTTKTYGSKKPSTSVFSGFTSFSSSFGFGRSTQSSFNDTHSKPVASDEHDDWFNAFYEAPGSSQARSDSATVPSNNRTDAKVLKESKADNKKKDGDDYISLGGKDSRRPKDLKALLARYSFEELERVLQLLDKARPEFNKYLGKIVSISQKCQHYYYLYLLMLIFYICLFLQFPCSPPS